MVLFVHLVGLLGIVLHLYLSIQHIDHFLPLLMDHGLLHRCLLFFLLAVYLLPLNSDFCQLLLLDFFDVNWYRLGCKFLPFLNELNPPLAFLELFKLLLLLLFLNSNELQHNFFIEILPLLLLNRHRPAFFFDIFVI